MLRSKVAREPHEKPMLWSKVAGPMKTTLRSKVACESCEKSYAQSNHLSLHIRRAHKGPKNKIVNEGRDNSIDNDFLIEQAKRNKAIVKLQRIEYSNLASEWIPLATLKILKAANSKLKSSKKY